MANNAVGKQLTFFGVTVPTLQRRRRKSLEQIEAEKADKATKIAQRKAAAAARKIEKAIRRRNARGTHASRTAPE